MKRTMKVAAIAILLVFGLYAGRHYSTAEDAAINCHEVQNCLSDGYWMESCVPQPIMYLVPPEGNHEWGTVQVEMRCDPSLGQPPVSITCNIQARNHQGVMQYRETHNTVLIPIR